LDSWAKSCVVEKFDTEKKAGLKAMLSKRLTQKEKAKLQKADGGR